MEEGDEALSILTGNLIEENPQNEVLNEDGVRIDQEERFGGGGHLQKGKNGQNKRKGPNQNTNNNKRISKKLKIRPIENNIEPIPRKQTVQPLNSNNNQNADNLHQTQGNSNLQSNNQTIPQSPITFNPNQSMNIPYNLIQNQGQPNPYQFSQILSGAPYTFNPNLGMNREHYYQDLPLTLNPGLDLNKVRQIKPTDSNPSELKEQTGAAINKPQLQLDTIQAGQVNHDLFGYGQLQNSSYISLTQPQQVNASAGIYQNYRKNPFQSWPGFGNLNFKQQSSRIKENDNKFKAMTDQIQYQQINQQQQAEQNEQQPQFLIEFQWVKPTATTRHRHEHNQGKLQLNRQNQSPNIVQQQLGLVFSEQQQNQNNVNDDITTKEIDKDDSKIVEEQICHDLKSIDQQIGIDEDSKSEKQLDQGQITGFTPKTISQRANGDMQFTMQQDKIQKKKKYEEEIKRKQREQTKKDKQMIVDFQDDSTRDEAQIDDNEQHKQININQQSKKKDQIKSKKKLASIQKSSDDQIDESISEIGQQGCCLYFKEVDKTNIKKSQGRQNIQIKNVKLDDEEFDENIIQSEKEQFQMKPIDDDIQFSNDNIQQETDYPSIIGQRTAQVIQQGQVINQMYNNATLQSSQLQQRRDYDNESKYAQVARRMESSVCNSIGNKYVQWISLQTEENSDNKRALEMGKTNILKQQNDNINEQGNSRPQSTSSIQKESESKRFNIEKYQQSRFPNRFRQLFNLILNQGLEDSNQSRMNLGLQQFQLQNQTRYAYLTKQRDDIYQQKSKIQAMKNLRINKDSFEQQSNVMQKDLTTNQDQDKVINKRIVNLESEDVSEQEELQRVIWEYYISNISQDLSFLFNVLNSSNYLDEYGSNDNNRNQFIMHNLIHPISSTSSNTPYFHRFKAENNQENYSKHLNFNLSDRMFNQRESTFIIRKIYQTNYQEIAYQCNQLKNSIIRSTINKNNQQSNQNKKSQSYQFSQLLHPNQSLQTDRCDLISYFRGNKLCRNCNFIDDKQLVIFPILLSHHWYVDAVIVDKQGILDVIPLGMNGTELQKEGQSKDMISLLLSTLNGSTDKGAMLSGQTDHFLLIFINEWIKNGRYLVQQIMSKNNNKSYNNKSQKSKQAAVSIISEEQLQNQQQMSDLTLKYDPSYSCGPFNKPFRHLIYNQFQNFQSLLVKYEEYKTSKTNQLLKINDSLQKIQSFFPHEKLANALQTSINRLITIEMLFKYIRFQCDCDYIDLEGDDNQDKRMSKDNQSNENNKLKKGYIEVDFARLLVYLSTKMAKGCIEQGKSEFTLPIQQPNQTQSQSLLNQQFDYINYISIIKKEKEKRDQLIQRFKVNKLNNSGESQIQYPLQTTQDIILLNIFQDLQLDPFSEEQYEELNNLGIGNGIQYSNMKTYEKSTEQEKQETMNQQGPDTELLYFFDTYPHHFVNNPLKYQQTKQPNIYQFNPNVYPSPSFTTYAKSPSQQQSILTLNSYKGFLHDANTWVQSYDELGKCICNFMTLDQYYKKGAYNKVDYVALDDENTKRYVPIIPNQTNQSDCGIFYMLIIKKLLQGVIWRRKQLEIAEQYVQNLEEQQYNEIKPETDQSFDHSSECQCQQCKRMLLIEQERQQLYNNKVTNKIYSNQEADQDTFIVNSEDDSPYPNRRNKQLYLRRKYRKYLASKYQIPAFTQQLQSQLMNDQPQNQLIIGQIFTYLQKFDLEEVQSSDYIQGEEDELQPTNQLSQMDKQSFCEQQKDSNKEANQHHFKTQHINFFPHFTLDAVQHDARRLYGQRKALLFRHDLEDFLSYQKTEIELQYQIQLHQYMNNALQVYYRKAKIQQQTPDLSRYIFQGKYQLNFDILKKHFPCFQWMKIQAEANYVFMGMVDDGSSLTGSIYSHNNVGLRDP